LRLFRRAAAPLGDLNPAADPLIEAEKLSKQPEPPQAIVLCLTVRHGCRAGETIRAASLLKIYEREDLRKRRMNILYINHYAGSLKHGMEYRPFYLAREWRKAGHQVRIVAASFSHVRSKQPQFSGWQSLETIDGVEYLWLKTPSYPSNGVLRFWNIVAFCFQLFWRSPHVLDGMKPDLVIASSTYPMDIFPACFLAKRSGGKLVYEVHDLWPLSPIELGGMSPNHPFIRLVQYSEDFAYRASDRVVSLLPLAKDYMVSRGMSRGKFIHIPNGISFEEWDGQNEVCAELVDQVRVWKANGCFTVAYAGTHGVANSLIDLIEAARQLENENIKIILIGDGLEKKALEKAAQGLNNVYFHPSIPKRQIPATLQEFDALYIGLKDNPLYRFGISLNKLFDYLAAGRPVLEAINSGNDPVQEAQAGLRVEPGNPQKIAEGLLQLSCLSQSERQKMGENGRVYVRKNNDYAVLARRFLETV
jgi:glycosyltransferase involved in cell wall biosynthesis